MSTTSDALRRSLSDDAAAMLIEREIEIARPVEDVFAYVADPAGDVRWCAKVRSVEPAGEDRWTVRHKPVPWQGERQMDYRRVASEPPNRLEWLEDDGDDVFQVTYELSPTASGGTLFRQRTDAQVGAPRLLHPLFRAGIGRDMAGQLRALKGLLEGA